MSSNEDATVITGLGVHSSLGGAVRAAASFRCGLSRAHELADWPYFDDDTHAEQRLKGNPAMGIAPGFQGAARLLKLGACALEDLQRSSTLTEVNVSKLGLFIALPAAAARQIQEPTSFVSKLCQLGRVQVDSQNIRTYREGRVGAATAIQDARAMLQSGRLDHCVIGALDSLLGSEQMAEFIAARQIKAADNPVGLIPGEGAGFILLERSSIAKRRGAAALATLHQPSRIASPEERGVDQEPPGKALGEAMLQALNNAHAGTATAGTLYSDLNGSTVRAVELGSAMVRLSSVHPLGSWRRRFPAESFGDTGTASGVLAICLAVRAFARGYALGDQALVVMSSERGSKAAIALGRSDHGASI